MKRLNFTFDQNTLNLLNQLAEIYYDGNKSQTVRAALENLAKHTGHEGWVIAGYSPKQINHNETCHECHHEYAEGAVLYSPVFEWGKSADAMDSIPAENWLDCPECIEKKQTNNGK